jgi:hypothetical protein
MLFCKCLDDPHREFFSGVSAVALVDDWHTGWDAHCPGLTAARKRESDWRSEAERWETASSNSNAGWDIPADDPHHLGWQASNDKQIATLHAVSSGWTSVEGGIEVSIKVHSSVGDLAEARTTCRCLCIRTDPSFQPDQLSILQLRRYFLWKLRIPSFLLLTSLVRRLQLVCFPLP